MTNSIGYHTRLYSDNTKKIVGGSFGGSLDLDTVNRLAKNEFTVSVRESGVPVFVDRHGRQVTLYISVDAAATEKGIRALREWALANERNEETRKLQSEKEEAEIEGLLGCLSHEEIVRRLKSL